MLPAIAAGVSIASSIAGIAGGLSANKDAKEAAKEQAKLTFSQRMEEIRREKLQQQGILGTNRAAVGASNIQMSGSAKRHMDEIQSRFSQDIAWRSQAARQERKAILKGAPGGMADMATIAGGIGGIANTAMRYYG